MLYFLTCYYGNHTEMCDQSSRPTRNSCPLIFRIVRLHVHNCRYRQWALTGGPPTTEQKNISIPSFYKNEKKKKRKENPKSPKTKKKVQKSPKKSKRKENERKPFVPDKKLSCRCSYQTRSYIFVFNVEHLGLRENFGLDDVIAMVDLKQI